MKIFKMLWTFAVSKPRAMSLQFNRVNKIKGNSLEFEDLRIVVGVKRCCLKQTSKIKLCDTRASGSIHEVNFRVAKACDTHLPVQVPTFFITQTMDKCVKELFWQFLSRVSNPKHLQNDKAVQRKLQYAEFN